jgi:quinol monooxygenase YgiN
MAYVVCVTWTAKKGSENVVDSALRQLEQFSRAEAGCQAYVVHRDRLDSRVFHLFEAYDNKEAFQEHTGSDHFRRLAKETAIPVVDQASGALRAVSQPERDWSQALYERVCDSYHKIDDLRMKLLGLLPLATGAAVLLGLGQLDGPGISQQAIGTIGIFGFVITLGLLALELHGIMKCHHYIATAQRIERMLGDEGQFLYRPSTTHRFINEPFAAALIYPSSLAFWMFLSVTAFFSPVAATISTVATFVMFLVLILLSASWVARNYERIRLRKLYHMS